MLQYILWQCYIEIEDHFCCVFQSYHSVELQLRAGLIRASWISNESMKVHMSPALNRSNDIGLPTQWCIWNTRRNNLLTTAQDYHICTTCFLARNHSGYVKSVLLVFRIKVLGLNQKRFRLLYISLLRTSFFTNLHTTINKSQSRHVPSPPPGFKQWEAGQGGYPRTWHWVDKGL